MSNTYSSGLRLTSNGATLPVKAGIWQVMAKRTNCFNANLQ